MESRSLVAYIRRFENPEILIKYRWGGSTAELMEVTVPSSAGYVGDASEAFALDLYFPLVWVLLPK